MFLKKALNTLRHKVLIATLCLLAVSLCDVIFSGNAWAQNGGDNRTIAPQVPLADRRQKNKVFLEHADYLVADEKVSTEYQILRGNVVFRKEGVFMYCDSAYFYDASNSLDAFGNVKMNQGDTLFVYSDVMYYSGTDEIAQLRHNVRLENKDMTLYTDSLDYDMIENLGYYFDGGRIVDSENELVSVYGQYDPDTKDAEFLFDVELINDKYVMRTDTLHYNTSTHIADIVGPTTIVSDSNVIYSQRGWYDTEADKATLFDRSLLVGNNGIKLTGDTLYYDRNAGYGEAFGNMLLTDSVHNSLLDGNYGFHNERENKSFATHRARAREVNGRDTLYLHGDTIRTHMLEDSSRVMIAEPNVRFYRFNIQGLCDSMTYVQRDSMLYMDRHAILWSGERQISGNSIYIHMNDSTADYALLPDYGFMAEFIGEVYFNQLSGKEMKAYFKNQELRQLDVNGNVQLIMFPMEEDSTYNKLVDAESSYMILLLKPKQEIDKITMWPEVTGNVTPLYLAKKSQYYLAGFAWYDVLRPQSPDDIFIIPKEMEELFNAPTNNRRVHRN